MFKFTIKFTIKNFIVIDYIELDLLIFWNQRWQKINNFLKIIQVYYKLLFEIIIIKIIKRNYILDYIII